MKMSASRSQARQSAINAICAAILMAMTLITGCDAHSTHQCTAIFLDGQGGEVIGEAGFDFDSATLGELSPEYACLRGAAEESPFGMMVIHCTCESAE